MKVLIGSNPMGLEEAIPDLKDKYTDIEFVRCTNREDTARLIADADVYMGWLNRDGFLTART